MPWRIKRRQMKSEKKRNLWIQYIYSEEWNYQIIDNKKRKKIDFWNNKFFITDNNNDENRSDI